MLTSRHRALVTALGAAILFATAPVGAQDSATAAAMFDKGVKEMQAGRFDAACPAFAESYRLDPQPGALFTQAECEAKAGKVASADTRYEEYLELFGRMAPAQQKAQRGRDKTAIEQRKKLAPLIPRITLVLPANAPHGTTVRKNGVALALVTLGTALPFDPGVHVIATLVPGGTEHEQRITVTAGDKKQIELEIVVPPPAPSAPPPVASSAPPVVTAPATTAPPTPPTTPPPVAQQGSSNTLAYILTGVGIVGLAAGGVTGYLAMGKKKTADDNCPNLKCNDKGMSAVDDGRTFGLVSTIGFGVGGAGLLTGVVLLLASGSGDKPQPTGKGYWKPMVASPRGNDALVGVEGTW
jgi:hypothetical protein